MTDYSKERELAVCTLEEITRDGAYNNLALKNALAKNNALPVKQKAFVTELVNGALRNLIYIDYVINRASSTPTDKMKPFILNDLRVAVYQILFMDRTPNSAACDEAVTLTKKRGLAGLSGFVNGVLRSIAQADVSAWELPLDIKYSYPKWLIDYWRLSIDDAWIHQMLEVNSRPPIVTICANTLRTNRDSLRKKLIAEGMQAEDGQLPQLDETLYISKTNDLSQSKAFESGLFHVVDESAMLAVKFLDPQPGQFMIDVCAAPGGKSFYAAYLMCNQGKIISTDLYPHKIELIKTMAGQLGINIIEASVADAAVYNPALCGKADRLLLDVPCSGFGLVRKKPDIKYTKTMADIDSLVKLQREIFAACLPYVKSGGTIVYSTCTVSAKENEENVSFFMKNYPVRVTNEAQLWPGEHRDGFYIAQMVKV